MAPLWLKRARVTARDQVSALAASRGVRIKRVPIALSQNPGWALRLGFDHVVSHYLLNKGDPADFRFVQIGAHDGVAGDPINEFVRRYGWQGVLVEPQRRLFEKLKANYSEHAPRLQFVNAAIADQRETRTMYTVEGDHLPEWTTQLASFSRDHILRHGRRRLEQWIVAREVECLSVNDVLTMASGPIDLLQVDVEGYDYEVLRRVDWATYRPPIVHFEHRHLSREDHDAALTLLAAEGYLLATERHDTTAYLREAVAVATR